MGRAEQKAETRQRILESAGELLRRGGIAAASVQDVMAGAGLTVGGFYAHFASKEKLVEETIRATMRRSRAKMRPTESEASPLDGVLRRYLSRAHRDETYNCPLPSIAGEIATGDGEHADVLAEELTALARGLATLLPPDAGGRERALALVALLYGGLTLARATKGTALSDELLRACRSFAREALGLKKGSES